MKKYRPAQSTTKDKKPGRLRPSLGLRKAVADLERYAREVEEQEPSSARFSSHSTIGKAWGI